MLISKGRLDPCDGSLNFINFVLAARNIEVLPITPEIAAKSVQPDFCPHGDLANRIIAASAILHKSKLVTSDQKLATVAGLHVVW